MTGEPPSCVLGQVGGEGRGTQRTRARAWDSSWAWEVGGEEGWVGGARQRSSSCGWTLTYAPRVLCLSFPIWKTGITLNCCEPYKLGVRTRPRYLIRAHMP